MSNSIEASQASVFVLVINTDSENRNLLELPEGSDSKVLVAATPSENRNLLEPSEDYPSAVLVKHASSKSNDLLELPKADQLTVLANSAFNSDETDRQDQPTDQTEVLVSQQGLEENKVLEPATSNKVPKELLPLLRKLTISQMEDLQQYLDAALKTCYWQLEELEKERQQLLSLGSIYPGEILPYSPSKTNAQGEKYNYYVFRAPTKCLPGPQGGLVKNIHLGKPHSPRYKRFKDMIGRRERLAQIEKQIKELTGSSKERSL
jgi:hypothetical protein